MVNWERFFECSCGGEFIAVVKDDYGIGAKLIDMGFFSFGSCDFSLSFREKLRWCWRILRKGKPYSDMVTMLPDEARKMGEYLIEITEENKSG